MIHTIAQKTADIFCRQNVADEEKKEIYIYGIELLVSSLIGAVLILGISIGIGKIWIPCRYLCALQRCICTDLSVDCRHMDILQSA